MSSYELRQLPNLLGLGFRQNIMSKSNPSVQFKSSIADNLKSLDTNFEKEPFYRHMQLDKLLDTSIQTSGQRHFAKQGRNISIVDSDIQWADNVGYRTKRGIKLIDYYQPHNNLKLYENYFVRKNRIGDLAYLNCLTPVGFTVTTNTEVLVDYTSSGIDNLDCNVVIVDISANKDVTIMERFESVNTTLTRIFYIIRENANVDIKRNLSTSKQYNQVVESYFIQHPSSRLLIEQVSEDNNYLQTTFDFDIYNKCRTNIYTRNASANESSTSVSINVNHLGEGSKSNIDVRSVGRDSAYFSFKGNINVVKKAENVSANMTNKNLLVSDTATAITEPMLDINTKEIECSHGCTVSNVDEDSLYYLQARGFSKEDATNILIENFLNINHERTF